MSLETLFATSRHEIERQSLPILSALAARYAREIPFGRQRVVFGHILVRNALVLIETLVRGGAKVVLCEAHPSPAEAEVRAELGQAGIPVLPLLEAVEAADIYLDVGAVLGRVKTPRGAAEATRTGVRHYRDIACPVVSADDSRSKHIEGFFGTGDSFVRAWNQLRPGDPLRGKRLVQFGYGKIGRGVAHHARSAGMQAMIVDTDSTALAQADVDGFASTSPDSGGDLERFLGGAEVVISVTGVPGILSQTVPVDWIRANRPVLVNLGAEDEFGPGIPEEEILGGRAVPLNFHLEEPTRNRYIDAALAAHVLALEALLTRTGGFPPGIHPLPEAMDRWVIETWRGAWPEEDLTGIAETLQID